MKSSKAAWVDLDIALCVYRAAVNWMEWRDCFEHSGDLSELPVLASDDRFGDFAHEYGLRWLGNAAPRRRFRIALRRSQHFAKAIAMQDPRRLDRCIDAVRSEAGKREMSAITKIATFAAPGTFMPFDRFARAGLKRLGAETKDFVSCTAFLDAVSRITPLALRNRITAEIRRAGLHRSIADQQGFESRVLDCALMAIGGRWS